MYRSLVIKVNKIYRRQIFAIEHNKYYVVFVNLDILPTEVVIIAKKYSVMRLDKP